MRSPSTPGAVTGAARDVAVDLDRAASVLGDACTMLPRHNPHGLPARPDFAQNAPPPPPHPQQQQQQRPQQQTQNNPAALAQALTSALANPYGAAQYQAQYQAQAQHQAPHYAQAYAQYYAAGSAGAGEGAYGQGYAQQSSAASFSAPGPSSASAGAGGARGRGRGGGTTQGREQQQQQHHQQQTQAHWYAPGSSRCAHPGCGFAGAAKAVEVHMMDRHLVYPAGWDRRKRAGEWDADPSLKGCVCVCVCVRVRACARNPHQSLLRGARADSADVLCPLSVAGSRL